MTITEIWDDSLIHFDEDSSGKYNADGGVFGLRLVNRVYREVCRDALCSRTNTTLVTVADTREVSLPAGFVALAKVLYKPTGYTVGYQLERTREGQFQEEDTGTPKKYYLVGTTALGIVPLPDAVYSLPLYYYQGPTAEAIGAATPSLVPTDWHHVIVYGTVYQLFRVDNGDDGQGAVKWRGIYREELQALKDYLREGCNADTYAGVR